jgi:hypothetical protein
VKGESSDSCLGVMLACAPLRLLPIVLLYCFSVVMVFCPCCNHIFSNDQRNFINLSIFMVVQSHMDECFIVIVNYIILENREAYG